MVTNPGIQIKVDSQYAFSGPMPVHVTMVADMPTYYANNGILDKAMELFLIRRDAPGIQQIAKLDPHAIMDPDTPLPPPVPGEEPSGLISEERTLDGLAYGAEHQGAADYFVVGVFAGYLSDPQRTSIVADFQRLPAATTQKIPPYVEDKKHKLLPLPLEPGIAARPQTEPVAGVEGAFRIAEHPAYMDGEPATPPFVTIVAARIDPQGGVSSGSFIVDSTIEKTIEKLNQIGQFFIPFGLLTPEPAPGHYRVIVFCGDYRAQPFEMEVV